MLRQRQTRSSRGALVDVTLKRRARRNVTELAAKDGNYRALEKVGGGALADEHPSETAFAAFR